MKHLRVLAVAALVCAGFSVHAAGTTKGACAKGELGGVVKSTKMQGETLVVGFQTAADVIRIRKKDDAAMFEKLSKLKVGDTHCYPDDGS